MAAELIMPTPPADQQQSRHFLPNMHTHTHAYAYAHAHAHAQTRPHHTRSQSYQVPPGLQISPLDTSGMPHNHVYSTPPSPKAQHKQYGGRPMYMPAVLRRCDEFPARKVTRCRTAGSTSSTDSDSTLTRANHALMSIPGLSVLGQRLARRSIGECNRTLDGEWKLDAFPQVNGVPTRKHWKVSSNIWTMPITKPVNRYAKSLLTLTSFLARFRVFRLR